MDDELPKWRCHKTVQADQIVAINDLFPNSPEIRMQLMLASGLAVNVDEPWIKRHNACVGGYYVIYEDGYTSFSPRAAFEGGYTRITNDAPMAQGA